ncbi:MAG: cupin domain-containing protein [Candidatus Hydrogenedentes bacterium]|nr:cupin domain-containing protein [Candidatus Hydrogenedentota bacterium]
MEPYTIFADLAEEAEVPEDGILSRPVFNNESLRAVLFAMSAGQELTEHTTTMEAVLFFVRGSARVSLGNESHEARAGTWIRMEPNLPHSIRAETPLVMMLLLLQQKKD